MPIPNHDQFFLDPELGPIKFEGVYYKDYLFSTYEKLSGKWKESYASLVLLPGEFEQKRLPTCLPPF